MEALEYRLDVFVYKIVVFAGAAWLFLPGIVLFEFLPDGTPRNALAIVALPCMLVAVFGGSWIAREAARLRVLESEGFFEALQNACVEARLTLSDLPGIRKLFAVRSGEPGPFEPPDSRRFGGE